MVEMSAGFGIKEKNRLLLAWISLKNKKIMAEKFFRSEFTKM